MTPVVELTAVTVRLDGTLALDAVDLSVEAGERVAVLGPSGAGKSTLLAVMAGRRGVDGGEVSVLGAAAGALRGRARRRHACRVGLVEQDPPLVGSLRVVHNVNAGLLGRWSTARALMSLVAPRGRDEVERLLEGLDLVGVADRRTDELSGGERQRVAVARTLRQQPVLVLADEPVASLDPRTGDLVLGRLCDPAAERTVVVALHDPALARRHATRLVGLRSGRLVFDTTPSEVDERRLAALYAA